MKRLWRRIEWFAARLLVASARGASPRGVRRLARMLGDGAWLVLRKRRAVANANVRTAFPAAPVSERARIVRFSFRSFALTIAEALRLPESPPWVQWSEPDVLEPIIRAERPAIILGGHLGNWELAAWAIAHRGRRLHLVVAPPHNPFVARFMDEHRRRCGVVPHDRDSSLRPLLAALRRGDLVGTAADQFPGRTIGVGAHDAIVNVPFLGRQTPFGTGMFRLALSARVPVVALNAARCGELNDGTGHRFEVMSELIWDGELPLPREAEMAERWSAWLEAAIRAHPEQYLWIHRRWKTTARAANCPFVRVSAAAHLSSE